MASRQRRDDPFETDQIALELVIRERIASRSNQQIVALRFRSEENIDCRLTGNFRDEICPALGEGAMTNWNHSTAHAGTIDIVARNLERDAVQIFTGLSQYYVNLEAAIWNHSIHGRVRVNGKAYGKDRWSICACLARTSFETISAKRKNACVHLPASCGRPLLLTERRNAPKDAFHQWSFSETTTVKPAIKESASLSPGKSADATHQRLFHMSMTEASLTFPPMMSFPCCRTARLAVPKSENASGWFSLKTRLAAEVTIAPGRHIRTTMSYRFGEAGMPVKATEYAREDKGMKFVSLVKKKRMCRHAGHSTGDDALYIGTSNAGRCGDCYPN